MLAIPVQYSQVYDFSLNETEKFWYAVLAYSRLNVSVGSVNVNESDSLETFKAVLPFTRQAVLSSYDTSDMAKIPRWFPEIRLNFTENILCSARYNNASKTGKC